MSAESPAIPELENKAKTLETPSAGGILLGDSRPQANGKADDGAAGRPDTPPPKNAADGGGAKPDGEEEDVGGGKDIPRTEADQSIRYRYKPVELSLLGWPRDLSPELPATLRKIEDWNGGLIVLVGREDSSKVAAQLAVQLGHSNCLVAPDNKRLAVDPTNTNPEELADGWIQAAGPAKERVLLSQAFTFEDIIVSKLLQTPDGLQIVAARLRARNLTVFLPVKVRQANHIVYAHKLRSQGGHLVVALIPWAHLFIAHGAVAKGDLAEEQDAADISSLPIYLSAAGEGPFDNTAIAADRHFHEGLSKLLDESDSWEEFVVELRRTLIEYRAYDADAFVEHRNNRAPGLLEAQKATLAAILSPPNKAVRNEIAIAMLLTVAFCNGLSPVAFRAVVNSILPPGSVPSVDQLSPELRDAWNLSDQANRNAKRDREPLPSWDDLMSGRAFDEAMGLAGIVASEKHVRFGTAFREIDVPALLASSHVGLINAALSSAVRRASILDPANTHFVKTVELFSRVEAKYPGRVDRNKMIEALTNTPLDLTFAFQRRRMMEAHVAVLSAGADPGLATEAAEAQAAELDRLEQQSRDALDRVASERFGSIIQSLFEASPPTAARDGFADRIIEELTKLWVSERAQVLMNGMLDAMRRAPEAFIDRIWRLFRHLFERLGDGKHSDSEGGLGRRDVVQGFERLFREPSNNDLEFVRTWLIACRRPCPDNLTWDAIQILAHEGMVEVGIRWVSRPFKSGSRGDLLAKVLLSDEGDGADRKEAIDGFVVRFFGDLALERARALERLAAYRKPFGALFEARLRDVFWVLLDGSDYPRFDSSHALVARLVRAFEVKLAVQCRAPCEAELSELANFVVEQAVEFDQHVTPASPTKMAAATHIAELFRAAALVHWRFEMAGVERLVKGAPVTVRLRMLLDRIASVRRDHGSGLADALGSLAALQRELRYVAKSAGEKRLAELFDDKADAIEQIELAMHKRSISLRSGSDYAK
ncbi:hypothetical protein [Methylocapsa sp. S129]|uniref:hypothetical protein n=1 Tax=Methylocapsa sp. S129 TaxID=1641869 RepID=UPI00131DD456|nr:hypothetical protein [Methylocapsa sp. S129]